MESIRVHAEAGRTAGSTCDSSVEHQQPTGPPADVTSGTVHPNLPMATLEFIHVGVFAYLMSLIKCFLAYAGAPAHVRYTMLSLIMATMTPIVSEYHNK